MSDTEKFEKINAVRSDDIQKLREELTQSGFRVYELDGRRIRDRNSLLVEIRRILPQDPPLVGTTMKWDAVADSLWGGLDQECSKRSAIIWTDADQLLELEAEDLRKAMRMFAQVASLAIDSGSGISNTCTLMLFLGAPESRLESLRSEVAGM